MSTTELAARDQAAIIEQVVVSGDLSKLTPGQRGMYYMRVCESLSLNPFTKPFQYITLNGRLTLYATRDCTDQLRRRDGLSITITDREMRDDIYIVTAKARNQDNREDESTGVVSITGLKGDALANALMKAETKAKRRVTLSIAGLGWADETEVDTIPDARRVNVDTETGEITEEAKPAPKPKAKSKPSSGETPSCADCSQPILERKLKTGEIIPVSKQLKYSREKFGRDLCLEHYMAAQEAKAKSQTDGQATNEPGEDDWVEDESVA